jgi:hypothetical protein
VSRIAGGDCGPVQGGRRFIVRETATGDSIRCAQEQIEHSQSVCYPPGCRFSAEEIGKYFAEHLGQTICTPWGHADPRGQPRAARLHGWCDVRPSRNVTKSHRKHSPRGGGESTAAGHRVRGHAMRSPSSIPCM